MTLDDIRKLHGWTWEEMAAIMGVPLTTLHGWHREGLPGSVRALGRLARVDPNAVRDLVAAQPG